MGLFDWPSPALAIIDNLISFIPSLLRLCLWGAVTGILSMLCYRACSNQHSIAEARQASLCSRKAMSNYQGHEFNELWSLAGASLRDSLRHFSRVLIPAVLGSLPALCIIVWVSNVYSHRLPEAGQSIVVSPTPSLPLALMPGSDNSAYQIDYPAETETVSIRALAYNDALLSLPLPEAVPVIHKHQWWNNLIGNPLGYIPQDSPIDSLAIGLERRHYLPIGPDWVRGWAFAYFTALLISSLAIKRLLRIH